MPTVSRAPWTRTIRGIKTTVSSELLGYALGPALTTEGRLHSKLIIQTKVKAPTVENYFSHPNPIVVLSWDVSSVSGISAASFYQGIAVDYLWIIFYGAT